MNPVPVKLIIRVNDLIDHQFIKFTECLDYLQTLNPLNTHQKQFVTVLVTLYSQFVQNVKHNNEKISILNGNYIDNSYRNNDNVIKKLLNVEGLQS